MRRERAWEDTVGACPEGVGDAWNIYCVWEIDMLTPCWVSQSLPPLVDAVNQTLSRPKQLQVSSMYRVLRGESLRRRHKNYMMQMFSRQEIEELNAHLANFPGYCFK